MEYSLPAPTPAPPSAPGAEPARHPWYSWRRLGYNFLTLSIVLHLLFGLGATSLIVATFAGQKPPVFKAPGAPGPNSPTHALEHKVSLAKKQNTMSAPPNARRVTTAGLAKVALPPMPATPKLDAAVLPATMAGMAGSTAGLGGFGGGGGSGGGGGGGGNPLSLFGLRTRTGGSFVGHLYDLKQDRSRRPTKVDLDKYTSVIRQFIQGGFNPNALAPYYQASTELYATYILTPSIDANEAPKAFGVAAEVQPTLWAAVYSGRVIPPESGSYKFVGFGDDMMVVRFNNRVVLDSGYVNPSGVRPVQTHRYNFEAGDWYKDATHHAGHGEGNSFTVEAGKSYDMQILIGEVTGGASMFQLFIMKDGVTYREDANHNPVCPVFRLVGSTLPQQTNQFPPFDPEGVMWKAELPGAGPVPKL